MKFGTLVSKQQKSFSMKPITALSIALLSLGVVVASSSPVTSQICIPSLGCVDSDGIEPTMRTFNVYVSNKSSRPTRVTVESWREPNNQGISCTGGGTHCHSSGWRTHHWNFSPGEKALLLTDVEGRNMYVTVKATDGSGVHWPRRKVDMGSTYTRFEYSFSE